MKKKNLQKKENAGENIIVKNSSWTFGGDVANKFDQHVRRSIPYYDEGHALICRISDFFINNNSKIYELGSSTGSLLKKIVERHKDKECKIIGIDNEKRMIIRAKKKLKKYPNVYLKKGNIVNYKFDPANLIISYYCIQFIPLQYRQKLINNIFKSLKQGGCFLFFEKIRMRDSKFQDIGTTIYTDFKLEQGYSPDEIIAKLRSLKGVLEPNLSKQNIKLLKKAGFRKIITIFNYIPFEGIMAIK